MPVHFSVRDHSHNIYFTHFAIKRMAYSQSPARPLLSTDTLSLGGSSTLPHNDQMDLVSDLNKVTQKLQTRRNLTQTTIYTALRLYVDGDLKAVLDSGPGGPSFNTFTTEQDTTRYVASHRPVIIHTNKVVTKWLDKSLTKSEVYTAITTYLRSVEFNRNKQDG